MKCFAIITTLVLSLLTPAFATMEWYSISTGQITTVSSDVPASQNGVYCSGNTMIWVKKKSVTDLDVIACNLTTGEVTNLSNADGLQSGGYIDGDMVIWTDYSGSENKLVVCNLISKTSQSYTLSPQATSSLCPISGTNVLYTSGAAKSAYLLDISTGNVSEVATFTNSLRSWDISGNMICWTDRSGSVGMKNLSTGVVTDIDSNGEYENVISTDGETIVWKEYDDNNWTMSVYMYDIASGALDTVFQSNVWDNGSSDSVDVDDGRIVYSYNGSIFLYDITSGLTTTIKERYIIDTRVFDDEWNVVSGEYLDMYYTSPRIDGDIIVWDPPASSVPQPATLALLASGLTFIRKRYGSCEN